MEIPTHNSTTFLNTDEVVYKTEMVNNLMRLSFGLGVAVCFRYLITIYIAKK